VQLVDDSPMMEGLCGLLVPAASCALAWHNVGDDGAGVGGLLWSSLPCGRSWWRVVLGAFVFVLGLVRVVVCASARSVPMPFLLK
jgi:hypothetical protein